MASAREAAAGLMSRVSVCGLRWSCSFSWVSSQTDMPLRPLSASKAPTSLVKRLRWDSAVNPCH